MSTHKFYFGRLSVYFSFQLYLTKYVKYVNLHKNIYFQTQLCHVVTLQCALWSSYISSTTYLRYYFSELKQEVSILITNTFQITLLPRYIFKNRSVVKNCDEYPSLLLLPNITNYNWLTLVFVHWYYIVNFYKLDLYQHLLKLPRFPM